MDCLEPDNVPLKRKASWSDPKSQFFFDPSLIPINFKWVCALPEELDDKHNHLVLRERKVGKTEERGRERKV